MGMARLMTACPRKMAVSFGIFRRVEPKELCWSERKQRLARRQRLARQRRLPGLDSALSPARWRSRLLSSSAPFAGLRSARMAAAPALAHLHRVAPFPRQDLVVLAALERVPHQLA